MNPNQFGQIVNPAQVRWVQPPYACTLGRESPWPELLEIKELNPLRDLQDKKNRAGTVKLGKYNTMVGE
jgi:hypothetical protein